MAAREARAVPLAAALVALLALWAPASAQLYHFGKNKVQFTDFRWQQMATAHFDLYFFAEEAELASYAARMAEEGYAQLERRSGHSVQRRVPLIIYSSHIYFEQTNVIPDLLPEDVGGFTEFLKGRVAVPLSGSLPEFERVLHHELAHVFTFDCLRRQLERRGIADFRPPPLWYSEGLAEYWSSEWSPFSDMVLRDALFTRRLVPIQRMYAIEGTYLMYKEGESICHFMAQRYGDDIFEQMFSQWWRAEAFPELFEIVTGETLERLDEEWQYDLRKRYLPEFARGDLPSHAAVQLTHKGFNVRAEAIPGDSTAFVFFRNVQGYTHIARQSLAHGTPHVVVQGERSTRYESLHALSTRPAVAPDGRRLAFAAQHRGRDHLFIWDIQSQRQVADLSFERVVAISSPTWSPDGRSLAFSGAAPGGVTDLYVADTQSGQATPLTHDLYHDRDPSWSPDGRWIAFSSDRCRAGREGHYNLYLQRADGSGVLQLTQGDHSDVEPSWAPDGHAVLFVSDRDTMLDVYAVRLAERAAEGMCKGPEVRLTRLLTGAFGPVWMPGQGGVLFTALEGGAFHVYQRRGDVDSLLTEAAVAAVPAAAGPTWSLAGLQGAVDAHPRPYRARMSLDIAQSQISQDPEFGTSGGVQVALSDVLGDDQYYFVLSHIAESDAGFADGLNVAVARLHQGQRVNVVWSLFRLNDRYTSTYGRFVREKRTGGYVELAYPFSLHDRLEARFSGRYAEVGRAFEGDRLSGWLASNYLTYTHDSSLWIPTGPLEGRRYSLGVGQTVDFSVSRRLNVVVYGDYRHYVRLTPRSALAVRLMGRQSSGPVPEVFSLGGSWTLRGYPWRSLWGRRLVLLNNELRFPLVDRLDIGFPFGSVDFSAFRGALFVDAGNVWNETFGEWKGSVGAGVRLALGGVFVFRLDGARRTDFRSLDNDTRWDFFFGWDF